MRSLSFDGLANLYDETRTVDPACLAAALEYLAGRFAPDTYRRVFEPGIGTGRIAIPLSERGYCVTGADISGDMLAILRKRLLAHGVSLRVSYTRADVTSLPFPDSSFDWALAVHLFYFVSDWRQAASEILRVVRGTGALVLMHTGTGAEIPWINERYLDLCRERGHPIEPVGASSTRQVVEYLTSLGCRAESIRDRWRWTERTRPDVALEYVRSRAYAFTLATPTETHGAVCAQLEVDARRELGELTTPIEVPNQISLVVVTRRPE